MTVYDPIGYAGIFLITLALTPQVYRTLKTRSTKDISFLWTLVLSIGLFIWIIYAILNLIWPAMIFSTVELLLALTLLVLKLVYK